MRALLHVGVEPLAVVAADALGHVDPRPLDGAPLARLLADLARVAFLPPLDAEDRRLRQDPQERAHRAEEPAVEVAHEHRGHEQHGERDPHRGRAAPGEHPERLDPAVGGDVRRRQEVEQDRHEEAVLDPGRAVLEPRRHLDPQPRRHHPVHQLGEGPEGAHAPAVEPPPQHRGDDRERREQVPGEAVAEDRHVAGHEPVHVDHRDELALGEPHVGDGGGQGHVLEGHALPEEPDEDQRREAGEEPEVDGLIAEQGAPGLRLRLVVREAPGVVTRLVVLEAPSVVFLLVLEVPSVVGGLVVAAGRFGRRRRRGGGGFRLRRVRCGRSDSRDQERREGQGADHRRPPSGFRNCRAMRRAPLRTARVALRTVMVAVATESMSAPTRNRSRTLLRTNCAPYSGVSIEK